MTVCLFLFPLNQCSTHQADYECRIKKIIEVIMAKLKWMITNKHMVVTINVMIDPRRQH